MRKIEIAMLCLVAVFAFSAAAAASASAKPVFGVCKKGAKGSGSYTESKCKTKGTGRYELEPVAAGSKVTAGREATIDGLTEEKEAVTVECAKEHGSLEVTGPSTFAETISYDGCEEDHEIPCGQGRNGQRTIPAAGSGELVWLNSEENEAGTITYWHAEFECDGSPVDIAGDVLSTTTVDKMGVSFVYRASSSKQEYQRYYENGEQKGPFHLYSEVTGEPQVYGATLDNIEAIAAKGLTVTP